MERLGRLRFIRWFLVAVASSCIRDTNVASAEAFATKSFNRLKSGVGGVSPFDVFSSSVPKESGLQSSLNLASPSESDVRGGGATENNGKPTLKREMLAEMIGTFLIVCIGTGSVMSAIFTDSLVGLFQIASVWIISVTIAICTTASISGAHLNPAISIAFACLRPSNAFGWKKVLPYTFAQLVGAILGSWLNLILYSSSISAFEQTNGVLRGSASGLASAKAFGEYFIPHITAKVAFLAEAVGTAILSFVIFALTHPKNDTMKTGFVPPFIGLTVGSLIAVLAPLTQAGFNPARDFGPRIVAFFAGWKTVAFQGFWVYILAPIVGAIVGAAIADKVLYVDS